jgi:putative tryptophan/tyrosine transport system substrate-binding protein
MRRREFIAGLSAAASPVVARAQPLPVVGFLHSQATDQYGNVLAAFHRGLSDAGYEEGRNIAIEYMWASDKIELAGTGGRSRPSTSFCDCCWRRHTGD